MTPVQKAYVLRLVNQLAEDGQLVLEAGTARPLVGVRRYDFERDELVLYMKGEQAVLRLRPVRQATEEEEADGSPDPG